MSPPVRDVALARPAVLNLRWRMTAQGNLPPVEVRSTQGRFIAGTTVLATVDAALVRVVTAPLPAVITIAETLQVPSSVLYRAHRLGFSRLRFERSFTDPTATATASVFFNLSGGLGADFDLTRVELRFDDGRLVRTVSGGEALAAVAELDYNGAGVLSATWEVADPASTSGQPLFRPLATVRRFLSAGRQATLKGPALPSTRPGLYLVRLRISEPAIGSTFPVVRYFVSVPRSSAPGGSRLGIVSPGAGARITEATQFAWRPHPSARAYRLELYDRHLNGQNAVGVTPALVAERAAATLRPGGAPITGMLLPRDRTSTVLSAPVRARLGGAEGTALMWRVVAIGGDGQVLATSEPRSASTGLSVGPGRAAEGPGLRRPDSR